VARWAWSNSWVVVAADALQRRSHATPRDGAGLYGVAPLHGVTQTRA
jgi:hypothetical protein